MQLQNIKTQDFILKDFLDNKYNVRYNESDEYDDSYDIIKESNDELRGKFVINNLKDILKHVLRSYKYEIEDLDEDFEDEIAQYLDYITDEDIEGTKINMLILYIREYIEEEFGLESLETKYYDDIVKDIREKQDYEDEVIAEQYYK